MVDAVSQVRKPRGVVRVNGTTFNAWESIEVTLSTKARSDTFQVRCPLYGLPPAMNEAWWSTETDIEIEILGGFAQAGGSLGSLTSLIVGPVDAIAIVPLEEGRSGGAALEIRGRDYSGTLIDSEVSQQYGPDQTAGSIIGTIVARHPPMTAQLAGDPDNVQSFYNQQGGRLVLEGTEWDVVQSLAAHQGFTATMQGRNLVFSPQAAPDTVAPYRIFCTPPSPGNPVTANVKTLRMARSLNIGRGVDVFVNSFDSATGQPPSRSRVSVRPGTTSSVGVRTVTHNIPGMSAAQGAKHAKSHAHALSKLERTIELRQPGDPALTVQTPIMLSGRGTAFDQVYYPDQITHRIDVKAGWAMEVRAKNKSKSTTVSEPQSVDPSAAPND